MKKKGRAEKSQKDFNTDGLDGEKSTVHTRLFINQELNIF